MVGTLKITRFNGIELFSISKAVIVIRDGVNVEPDEDGDIDDELQGALTLYVETDPKPIEYTTDDTIPHDPHPSFEIDIFDEIRSDELVGREFSVACGEDEESGEFVSRFYYFEHEPLNNNRITILSNPQPMTYSIRWTGSSVDPNYYDGSKDDAIIEIEANFTRWVRGDEPYG